MDIPTKSLINNEKEFPHPEAHPHFRKGNKSEKEEEKEKNDEVEEGRKGK